MYESYQETSDNHRSRAISKLHVELEKDIRQAVEVASSCGLWDLLRLLYEFRLARVMMIVPEYRDQLSPADLVSFHLNDEAMKYAISLVAKHGKWNDYSKIHTPLVGFDVSRVHLLESITRHINAKFETEILLNIGHVEVLGDRDQNCAINLQEGLRDPRRAMHFQFGLRIERFTRDAKNDPLPIKALIGLFKSEYSKLSALYEEDNGISLNTYCQGMLDIHDSLVLRGQQTESKLVNIETGLIDPLSVESFIGFARTFIMTDKEMETSLSPDFLAYLYRNPFDPKETSDSELRFHYVSRRPFMIGDRFAIFSPELVFDSMLGNTHYTFLESVKSKQKYMALSAIQFTDKISSAAVDAGYREVGRDIYLKEGRDDIGDIDLFLWNAETDHVLLIEAKNHTLPLPVYFRSPKAIDEHVSRNRDWEKKVKRRIEHLKGKNPSFCILGSWDYLVVTQMPEPLSHCTELFVLSIGEFKQWLTETPRPSSFSELHNTLLSTQHETYSPIEMQQLQSDGFVLLKSHL